MKIKDANNTLCYFDFLFRKSVRIVNSMNNFLFLEIIPLAVQVSGGNRKAKMCFDIIIPRL